MQVQYLRQKCDEKDHRPFQEEVAHWNIYESEECPENPYRLLSIRTLEKTARFDGRFRNLSDLGHIQASSLTSA